MTRAQRLWDAIGRLPEPKREAAYERVAIVQFCGDKTETEAYEQALRDAGVDPKEIR